MDVFLLQASASSGLAAGVVNGLGGDRMIRCMAESPREQPLGRLALESSPILAQGIQQLGAEHDVTILASLAPLNVDDHPLAINIADLQARQFGTPHPGGIERHQHDAMKVSQGRVDQPSHLLLTENDRQLQHFLGIRSFGHAPGPFEGLDVEEAQSRQPLVHRIWRQLPLLEQCGLVLANVLRTQLIGGTVEVPGEVFDGANVTIDGGLRVVTTLKFFEHDLAKMGHREILLSLPATLDQLSPDCSPTPRASVRRPTASFKSCSGRSGWIGIGKRPRVPESTRSYSRRSVLVAATWWSSSAARVGRFTGKWPCLGAGTPRKIYTSRSGQRQKVLRGTWIISSSTRNSRIHREMSLTTKVSRSAMNSSAPNSTLPRLTILWCPIYIGAAYLRIHTYVDC